MMTVKIRSFVRQFMVGRWLCELGAWLQYLSWRTVSSESDVMPSYIKRRSLVEALRLHGISDVVETGTFLGDTCDFLARRGYRVVTVEVQPTLAALARRRFATQKNVVVLEGDSGELMGDIIRNMSVPALFWLDGHYSGGPTGKGEKETPIVKEVKTIISRALPGSVVFVDDARCFGRDDDYPQLQDFLSMLSEMSVEDVVVVDDNIRFSVPVKRVELDTR